jgi:signal peptidase II|tara:strand:- start:387 stop:860 length:474 start_codon:yes stop_codon:yes gene_type:complete
MLKKNLYNLIIVFTVFFLDRVSKYIILNLSQPLEELNFSVTTFLNFNLVWNSGIAFGLFSFDQNIYYNVITSVIISVTLVIILITFKSKGLERFCYLIIIGGSLGNIFDRLNYSAVIDFIDISYNNFHWFIFNVADIFISLGVVILIVLEFLKIKKI